MAARKWAVLAIVAVGLLLVLRGVDGHLTDEPVDEDGGAAAMLRTGAATSDRGSAGVAPARTAAISPITRGALRLEGQVVDEGDQPLAGATVTVGSLATTSEADGSFAFDQLAEGDYRVAAGLGDRYGEEEASLSTYSDPVTLKLVRGATLVVRVVDATTRAPIADAEIKTSTRLAHTDDTGVARIRALDLGFERIVVRAVDRPPVKLWVTTDDPQTTVERTVLLDHGAPVDGVVVDPEGKPVAEASVSVEAANGWREQATSDAAGKWHVALLGPGTHKVSATAETYVARPDEAFVHDGVHARTDVVVRVDAGGQITGIVVDGAGRPVAGISVYGGGRAETDAAGRFRITGVDEGDHEVTASSATGAAPAVTVKVARGGHAEVRLVLEQGTIAGRVVDARGEPLEGAIVGIEGERGRHYARSDERGAFDFGGILPGQYAIAAQRGSESARDLPPGRPVKTGDRDIQLVLPDLGGITGRVMLAGKPVPFYGLLVSDKADPSFLDRPLPVRSPQGAFTLHDISVGPCAIVIVGPDFARTVIENIQVASGQTLDLGEIVVAGGRALHGRVVDERGAGVADAQVIVFERKPDPDDDLTLRMRMRGTLGARSDAGGYYVIAGIEPDKELHAIAIHPDRGSSAELAVAADATTLDLVVGAHSE